MNYTNGKHRAIEDKLESGSPVWWIQRRRRFFFWTWWEDCSYWYHIPLRDGELEYNEACKRVDHLESKRKYGY